MWLILTLFNNTVWTVEVTEAQIWWEVWWEEKKLEGVRHDPTVHSERQESQERPVKITGNSAMIWNGYLPNMSITITDLHDISMTFQSQKKQNAFRCTDSLQIQQKLDVINNSNNMNFSIKRNFGTAYVTHRTSQDEVTYSLLQKTHILICNTLNVFLRQLFLLNTWDLQLIILFQQGESSAAISHL